MNEKSINNQTGSPKDQYCQQAAVNLKTEVCKDLQKAERLVDQGKNLGVCDAGKGQ